MGFWMSTLSSAIGAFVGILGAIGIAKWQMNRSHKLNNIQFYIRFNDAQIYINRFSEKVDSILEFTERNRKHGRIFLNKHDFLEMRESLESAIKTVNKEIDEVDFDNFIDELGKVNQYAPVVYYKELNFLFFSMAILYNLLLSECKYLVNDLPKKIDMATLKGLTIRFI
jgi:hypothetical protein